MSIADRTYLFENVKQELLEKHRQWQMFGIRNNERKAGREKQFDTSLQADGCFQRKLKPCLKKCADVANEAHGSSGGSNNLTSAEESTSGTASLIESEGRCEGRSSDLSKKKVKKRVRVHRHDSIIMSDTSGSISKNLFQENHEERHHALESCELSTERNSGCNPKTSASVVNKIDISVDPGSDIGKQISRMKTTSNSGCIFQRVSDQVMFGASRLNHEVYQSYVAGILHSSKKSEKFLKLQKLYATLERISQLENMDIDKKDAYFQRGQTLSRSQSLSSLTLASDVRTSVGKLDHLSELRRIYQELEMVLEDRELSYFLKKDISKFKWKGEMDSGLYNRCHSIQDVIVAYQRKIFHEAFLQIYRQQEETEFNRAFSFERLRQKYQQMDKRAEVEKMVERFWRSQNQRRSVNSQNASKLSGTYICLMESARRKSRERAVHGYFMNESRNGYEIYVNSRRHKTKSNQNHSENFPLQDKLIVGTDVRHHAKNTSAVADGKFFHAVPHRSKEEFEKSLDDILWRQDAIDDKKNMAERRKRKEVTKGRQLENACFNGQESASIKVSKNNFFQKLNDSDMQENGKLVCYKGKTGNTNWSSQLNSRCLNASLINTCGKYIQQDQIDEQLAVRSPGSAEVDIMFKKSDCCDFTSTSTSLGKEINSGEQLTKTYESRQRHNKVLNNEVNKCHEKYLFSVEDGTNLSYGSESVAADEVLNAIPRYKLRKTEKSSHSVTEPVTVSTDFEDSYVAEYKNSGKNMLERNAHFLQSDPCFAFDHISAESMYPAVALDKGPSSYPNPEDVILSRRNSEDSSFFYPDCGSYFVSSHCTPTVSLYSEPVCPMFICSSHADARKISCTPKTNNFVVWQASTDDQEESEKLQKEFVKPSYPHSEQNRNGISMTVANNNVIGEFDALNLPNYSELGCATSRNELNQSGSQNLGENFWSTREVISFKTKPNTDETFIGWKNACSESSFPSQMLDVRNDVYNKIKTHPSEAVVSEINQFNVETVRKHEKKVTDNSYDSLTCDADKIHPKDPLLNHVNRNSRVQYDTNGGGQFAAFDYGMLQDLSRGMSFSNIVHCHRPEVNPRDLMRNLEVIGSEWQKERPQEKNLIPGSDPHLTARNGNTMALSC